ncbi:poly(3-hydroxybutyrate) depolymerase [Angulomicrobium tetraedrale]|uniref:Poly(3-hydroxybutyrate) depolymerase n=1 Tax=Ancylobacter tetraedralis TaxID=217068 RepID=A0A839Z1Y9_9HYPH|nr:polyhydroxyalkanoate depolymerase [Ancylobacter tetraedralis]MBB3770734.1 poly(3-hydroxybutyrate) depolymerase [Ancylobacter tetraedralis]
MAIGVFGDVPDAEEAVRAPDVALETVTSFSKPLYWMFEMGHAALDPLRMMADAGRLYYRNPVNPLAHTGFGKSMSAALEMFERSTRRYGKPDWGITETVVGATRVPVEIETVWERPFCKLLHFRRDFATPPRRPQPRMVIVAPLSGHYATLLRGTVQTLLPNHDLYITDWVDARNVPMSDGRFDLDDYIDYLIDIFRHLGGGVHALAVCQPAVPVLAAVARMEDMGDPDVPASMVLMGGPIDTRESPTAVNHFAEARKIDWFRRNVITTVPWPHAGIMRQVYPGFLQLHGFMSMNIERHLQAHAEMFGHLVKGDGDSATKHREFYDEYLSVMDLPAEYYLQTLEAVFIDHSLPKGEMTHRGARVDTSKIRNVALLTVEGENDDISGVGQTRAAHKLCSNLPDDKKAHYLQPTVGHYGVFNGSRFRAEIAPRISDFVLSHNWPRKGHNAPADAPAS